MSTEEKPIKQPMSDLTIYKIMLTITFLVSIVFFVKNIIGNSLQGAFVVGICLIAFSLTLLLMKLFHASMEHKQLVVSVSILFLVFLISINSGSYYSDDFPLYLAILGLTGLFLRPNYTKIQIILADILLILMYILHPEKAESLSQYLMCVAIFTLAAYLFYLTINRGYTYIQISKSRAEEAEALLNSLNEIGDELQKNFVKSTAGIEQLKEANLTLYENTEELKQGSSNIMQSTLDVADTCETVKEKVRATEKQVASLTEGIHHVEDALSANRDNIRDVNHRVESIQQSTRQVNHVFRLLEEHMEKITQITKQLEGISSNTTMLALNASIEAARAGQSGAGFAVVATQVQELAVDSNNCSSQVHKVVSEMQNQIKATTHQLSESGQAIEASLHALNDLHNGFAQLTEEFGALYQNIEEQNANVTQIDSTFENLNAKISEVNQRSQENQQTVSSITDAMSAYENSMARMVNDSRHLHELSSHMMTITQH